MKFLKYFFLIFLFFNLSSLYAAEKNLNTKITKNLRCLICQGQSVYDSDSEFANSIKILIDEKINQGLDEKEIYSYLKNRYGQWILYEPEFNKNTYFLWIFPIFVFLVGGILIYRLFIVKKTKIYK